MRNLIFLSGKPWRRVLSGTVLAEGGEKITHKILIIVAVTGVFLTASVTSADVLAAANVMLAALPDTYASQWDLTVLHSDCKQDILIGTTPVPEPATMMLLGIGGLGMLLHRRR